MRLTIRNLRRQLTKPVEWWIDWDRFQDNVAYDPVSDMPLIVRIRANIQWRLDRLRWRRKR